jgi:hypothetical protein
VKFFLRKPSPGEVFAAYHDGGISMMEAVTEELITKANAIIDEVEAMGDMVKAVESGLPKRRIAANHDGGTSPGKSPPSSATCRVRNHLVSRASNFGINSTVSRCQGGC